MLEIAVIIVSWNVKKYLSACLNSLNAELEQSNIKGTVWVIDNASTDGSPEMVTEQFPDVKLVANKDNLGFGRANNQGMRLATQKKDPAYFFLLNPDTVVQPKSIRHLIDFMEKNPRAGMSGPRLVFGSGRFQHSAFHFPGLAQLFFDLFPLPGRFYETAFNGRYPRAQAALNAPPFPIDHPLGAAINVRMSTIIGFAGGGGIGFVLNQEINLLNYSNASVMMISIAVVVATLDYLSSRIRSRII